MYPTDVNTIYTSDLWDNDLIFMYFHERKHDGIPMCIESCDSIDKIGLKVTDQ